MDCLFCKIAQLEIPSEILYEDADIVAFRDIHPAAPQHILIIPRLHIATLNDLEAEHAALVGRLVLTAQHLAKSLGMADAGYRVVMNCNGDAGQAVFHIHLHLLGGRALNWPPG